MQNAKYMVVSDKSRDMADLTNADRLKPHNSVRNGHRILKYSGEFDHIDT